MKSRIFDLTGRRALVTGSSQGIGLALARGLAEHGASVVLNSRTPARVEAAVATLRAAGLDAAGAAFDVTDHGAVAAAVDRIERDSGAIDILVNNAGMQFRAPLEDFPAEKFEELFRTNVSSIFNVGQAVARHMIGRRRGKIINIASVQSELARPSIAPYTATKGAVRNLTRGMATDWAKYGLQVNAIAPGYFKTPLNQALIDNPEFSAWLEKRTPAGRWGDVEELVGAAVFLAGDASSFINGQVIHIDGGITASI
jgi:gluconate 5-dehydrogenase